METGVWSASFTVDPESPEQCLVHSKSLNMNESINKLIAWSLVHCHLSNG